LNDNSPVLLDQHLRVLDRQDARLALLFIARRNTRGVLPHQLPAALNLHTSGLPTQAHHHDLLHPDLRHAPRKRVARVVRRQRRAVDRRTGLRRAEVRVRQPQALLAGGRRGGELAPEEVPLQVVVRDAVVEVELAARGPGFAQGDAERERVAFHERRRAPGALARGEDGPAAEEEGELVERCGDCDLFAFGGPAVGVVGEVTVVDLIGLKVSLIVFL
jgi:hypothetical protein